MLPSGFNPKARWDRHIPDNNSYDPAILDEKIDVFVLFKDAKPYPRIFIWNNKKYKIKRITYNWQEKRGQETIAYFTVSTKADLYQISFNNTTYAWRINKILT